MLILASQSQSRRAILDMAGISYTTQPANIDEQAITASAQQDGQHPRDIADLLAEMKAQKISNRTPSAFVLGCDQILDYKGQIFGKPTSKQHLTSVLKNLSGKTHTLWTANVIAQGGRPLWRHVGRADLTLKPMTQDTITDYAEEHWDSVRHCAGGYKIENTPALFSNVDGNWFDILGLSISPIIDFLSHHGIATPEPKTTPIRRLGPPHRSQ